jgi:glycosyltransferase involved in cell wall biosynthesis
MRCVLIGPVYPYRGGIAHYTTRLAQAIRERSHNLLLISFKRQYPQWLFPGQSDKDPSHKPLEAERAWYWIDSLNPLTWLTTFGRIKGFEPDAIIMQWWTTFWAPVWFLLLNLNRFFLRRPVLIICHNVLPHETSRWDPWLARLVLRRGTQFITQSAEEKRQLLTLIPGAQVEIHPLPAFDMLARHRVCRQEARERLGLPQDQQVLLFFGIVREYKGLMDILLALPKIRERLGRVLLIVAGEFWDKQQPYLEMIQRLGIEDSVRIDGRYIPDEEVGIYFSAADLLVAPYRQVTGSAAVQMARGFGLPIVTTRIGGLAEIADDATMYLVPPADPDALAAAASRYFEADPRVLPHESDLGDRFSWDHLALFIETLVAKALGSKETPN